MKRLSLFFLALGFVFGAAATTDRVPADGVYRFTFGVDETSDGSIPVPASAVCDMKGTGYYDGSANAKFSYGFLGTTETSWQDDLATVGSTEIATAIDGWSVVSGQRIVLQNATDAKGRTCVKGPSAADYLPAGASSYEGRYPIRFSLRAEERAYYAVTCTVANASANAPADVTLFSERCHIIAHHLALQPGETRTFAWSVELAPNVYKSSGTYYDNAVNIAVVGANAALASVTIVKQPQTAGTVRGEAEEKMNVGRTMWLCDDSTGTDQANATPFFSLQNFSGVGSGLSRWAPANLSIRNQGEGGLATNAKSHRQSCLLKPGDYLYVEYGHNESGTTSYTNNLETYLADATTAGAYLLIVSAVERRSSWNSETATWGRSLGGYAAAGEAWVEDKIAQGATNVAFIDLNQRYNTWMNQELQRIHAVNPDVSLNSAISFYYRSAKGDNVDNTHINNAGTDQAAYWVWYDARQRVAAGEAADATASQKVQAAVLKGVTTGYQETIGLDGTEENLPWQVTDEIINAGPAPNAFWDSPVTSGFAYVNDAVVADVAASMNADGSLSLSHVTMRILNPGNYYRAVVDVFDGNGTATRYWSWSNYDVGGVGATSGQLIAPGKDGFLTADRDQTAISACDLETLTIPADGYALVWFAKADDTTWQVGDNTPCSAKYPVYPWTAVLLENDCTSLNTWKVYTQAGHTETITSEGALQVSSTGADGNNTKKNYGALTSFADGAEMGAGRYRISFKAMIDAGQIAYSLGDAYNSTMTLFKKYENLLVLTTSSTQGYQSMVPAITVDAETSEPQDKVNKLRWVDVDLILDRDNDRASISVGGSDYVEYQNLEHDPGTEFSGTVYRHFGISCPGQMSSYAAVDEVRIVRLTPAVYPTLTVSAAANEAEMGSVTINGRAVTTRTLYRPADVVLTAESANPDRFAFVEWQDGDGAKLTSAATYFVENASADLSATAVFRTYRKGERVTNVWNFTEFVGPLALAPTAATNVTVRGMTFRLQNGDTMSPAGLTWQDPALGHKTGTETLSESGDHYIVYTPTHDGTLTMKFSVDSWLSGRKPHVMLKAANSTADCVQNYGDVVVQTTAANKFYTLSADLTAGTTYYIWTYAYNWGGGGYHPTFTIPEITFSYDYRYERTFDVAADETETFVGTLDAELEGVSKRGAGTLVLVGTNAFSGPLHVEAGTLKLGAPHDVSGIRHDYDATDVSRFVYQETEAGTRGVTNWLDRAGISQSALSVANYSSYVGALGVVTNENGYAGLYSDAFMMFENSNGSVAASTFIVSRFTTDDYSDLMGDWDDRGNSKGIRWHLSVRTGKRYLRRYGTDGSSTWDYSNLWENGELGIQSATGGVPVPFTRSLISIVGSNNIVRESGHREFFGKCKPMILNEAITYSRELSDDERIAVENFLMYKWGIQSTYDVLPTGAAVTVDAGATLDLSGIRPTVASLKLAEGAVVSADALPTNGVLMTAGTMSAVGAQVTIGGQTWTVDGRVVNGRRLVVNANADGTSSLLLRPARKGFVICFK